MRILTQTVNDFVVDQLSRVPEVKVVHTDQTGEVFYVWVLIEDDNDAALARPRC